MGSVDLRIYSPRWGHEDVYQVVLENDYMSITMSPRECRAIWRDNLDPEWRGEDLHEIMNNDSIYPPAVTRDLFEHAWLTWRNGELTDQEVEEELQLLAAWINEVTHAKPNSEFWGGYF